MKNIKRIKKSPYYIRVMRITAIATLVVLALLLVSSAFGLVLRPWTTDYMPLQNFSSLMILMNNLILIGGGFGIGLLATRGRGLSRDERIVAGGTYGLLTNALYFLAFGTFSVILFKIYAPWTIYVLAAGPFIAVCVTALFALIVRRFKDQSWLLPVAFLLVFWLNELHTLAQSILIATGSVADASLSLPAWFILVPSLLVSPLIAGIIAFFCLRRIGRLYRVYIASFLAALVFLVNFLSWRFVWGPQVEILNIVDALGVVMSVALLAWIVAGLIRARRLK